MFDVRFWSLILYLLSLKSSDGETEMFIVLCNPLIISSVTKLKWGVLENENSLTVNISDESDIKQSKKALI